MRVLMQARVNLFTAPGGDTVQIVKTAEHLRRCGIRVDVESGHVSKLDGFDLVHLFNLTRVQETYEFAQRAHAAGIPTLLSTIYWNTGEMERNADLGWHTILARALPLDLIERGKGVWRIVREGQFSTANAKVALLGFTRMQRATVRAIDHFLPNSEGEMALVRSDLAPGMQLPYTVVPNGVDEPVLTSGRNGRWGQYEGCVLCVGRMDGRKNQLNIVRALKGTSLRLVLAGQPAPNHKRYAERVRREGGDQVAMLGHLNEAELDGLYRVASVHCLPSWFETPGLASLEAAARNCALVVTDRGSTREYFGDDAEYCEPADPASIRNAILRAHERGASNSLRKRILNNYTWSKAAEVTLRAYEHVLRFKGNRTPGAGCEVGP